jgi:hypothetical protein
MCREIGDCILLRTHQARIETPTTTMSRWCSITELRLAPGFLDAGVRTRKHPRENRARALTVRSGVLSFSLAEAGLVLAEFTRKFVAQKTTGRSELFRELIKLTLPLVDRLYVCIRSEIFHWLLDHHAMSCDVL